MDKTELLKKICNLGTAITAEIKGECIVVKSCDFTNTSFTAIENLINVIFVNCKLANTTFANVKLVSCMFIACDLTNSTFTHCILCNTTFLKTVGKKSVFDRCDMVVVEFNDVYMDKVIYLYDENYSYETNLNIVSSTIKNMHMKNIDEDAIVHIEYSHMNNVDIDTCCLGENFVIYGTDMTDLHISDTNIYSSIIRDSDLSNSYISSNYISPMCNNVNFNGSEFDGSDMDSARFVECDMSNVKLHCSEIKNSTFDNCAMISTDMSKCYMLHNTEFRSSKLIDTNMQQLKISNCDFSGCIITNVNLAEVTFSRIMESSPNIIDHFPYFCVNGIEWDGIKIEDANDDTSRGRSTLKNAIIQITQKRGGNHERND